MIESLDHAVLQADRVQDQTVHLMGPGPGDQVVLALRLCGRLLDLDHHAPLVGHFEHGVGDAGGEGGADVGKGKTDDSAAAVPQPASAQIGHEVQLDHGGLDLGARLLPYSGRTGEHIGDGLRRDAGDEVTFPGSERMVRIPGETLRAVPLRIAAAVGPHKAPSFIAAARTGWFNSLVTDEATARAIDRSLTGALLSLIHI